jgi:lambda repressor-like predicted transcriptional regulator
VLLCSSSSHLRAKSRATLLRVFLRPFPSLNAIMADRIDIQFLPLELWRASALAQGP